MKRYTEETRALRSIWVDMWRRCTDPMRDDFMRYGGKGITVDPAWGSFETFLSDMGLRPKGRSLDRIDGNLGYSKANCRWATKEQQDWNRGLSANNKSGVKGVRFNTQCGLWQAYGMRKGRQYHLYLGPSKEEAIQARQAWELNIITEVENAP